MVGVQGLLWVQLVVWSRDGWSSVGSRVKGVVGIQGSGAAQGAGVQG